MIAVEHLQLSLAIAHQERRVLRLALALSLGLPNAERAVHDQHEVLLVLHDLLDEAAAAATRRRRVSPGGL